MKKQVGVWLDHKIAFVISLMNDRQECLRIESGVEPKLRLAGGSHSKSQFGLQKIASERKRQQRRKHQLRDYYLKIIHAVADADEMFFFGPGQAGQELKKELEHAYRYLAVRVKSIETTDKITENQMKARVRKFYLAETENAQ